MEITVTDREEFTVVSIAGQVDGKNSEELLATFDELLGSGKTRLIGDFQELIYMSSAGLRVLLGTTKKALGKQGCFYLANVQDDVLRVLEIAGFTKFLKVFPSIDKAISGAA